MGQKCKQTVLSLKPKIELLWVINEDNRKENKIRKFYDGQIPPCPKLKKIDKIKKLINMKIRLIM